MTETTHWQEITDYWQLLEHHNLPARLHPIASLVSWSHNYPGEYSPFSLFLDLSGWSLENLGEIQFQPDKHRMYFGYVETGYIGEAMATLADHPYDVEEYVTKLLEAELDV